jgi:hypothetical protein
MENNAGGKNEALSPQEESAKARHTCRMRQARESRRDLCWIRRRWCHRGSEVFRQRMYAYAEYEPVGHDACVCRNTSKRWSLLVTRTIAARSYLVRTLQIVLPSAVPSETSRNEDGIMSRKESLNLVVFASTFSSHEFTSSPPSHLAVRAVGNRRCSRR